MNHYRFVPRTTIGLYYEQVVICIRPFHKYSQQAP